MNRKFSDESFGINSSSKNELTKIGVIALNWFEVEGVSVNIALFVSSKVDLQWLEFFGSTFLCFLRDFWKLGWKNEWAKIGGIAIVDLLNRFEVEKVSVNIAIIVSLMVGLR